MVAPHLIQITIYGSSKCLEMAAYVYCAQEIVFARSTSAVSHRRFGVSFWLKHHQGKHKMQIMLLNDIFDMPEENMYAVWWINHHSF